MEKANIQLTICMNSKDILLMILFKDMANARGKQKKSTVDNGKIIERMVRGNSLGQMERNTQVHYYLVFRMHTLFYFYR